LMSAAERGHLDVVQLLLLLGADVNASDVNCRTALMYAAEEGQLEVVGPLIKAGAEVNISDGSGRTALMNASAGGHSKIVAMLLHQGAEVRLRDRTGRTAWSEAQERLQIAQQHRVRSVTPTEYPTNEVDRCSETIELLKTAGAAS